MITSPEAFIVLVYYGGFFGIAWIIAELKISLPKKVFIGVVIAPLWPLAITALLMVRVARHLFED